jgi:hypothetical protein
MALCNNSSYPIPEKYQILARINKFEAKVNNLTAINLNLIVDLANELDRLENDDRAYPIAYNAAYLRNLVYNQVRIKPFNEKMFNTLEEFIKKHLE